MTRCSGSDMPRTVSLFKRPKRTKLIRVTESTYRELASIANSTGLYDHEMVIVRLLESYRK
jgi:hypothetical protein